MKEYVIFTDSGCDIHPELLEKWGVKALPLTFRFDGGEEYDNNGMPISEFYKKMREGSVAKTAAVNVQSFYDAFKAILDGGNDILYLGFSSGLSTTYNSARLAAEQLRAEYPDRRIFTVDTLAASAGQGMLVYLAVEKKNEGKDADEVRDFIEGIKLKLCHWFTVDDLVYLKRGGRVSGVTAFVGNLLGIKPVLHVDNDGHLINVSKVRGRRTALSALADKYGELHDNGAEPIAFISHADCEDEAKLLAGMLEDKYGAKVELITDVGTVIGAHSGPGTMALFFVGKER